jgi:hypothetical protein
MYYLCAVEDANATPYYPEKHHVCVTCAVKLWGLASRDGKRIAFEVETGQSDAAANVAKCLAAGVDSVVVVATSKGALCNIARSVPPEPTFELWMAGDVLRGRWRLSLEKAVLL